LYKCYFQEEEGWWEGNLNGKIGMFPSNFVEVMEPEEADKHSNEFFTFLFVEVTVNNTFSVGYVA